MALLTPIPNVHINGITHVEKNRWGIEEDWNDQQYNRNDLHIR